ECAAVLPRAGGAELFRESPRPEHYRDALTLARRGPADRLQRRVSTHVPPERPRRVLVGLRAHSPAGCGVHRGPPVWIRPIPHRAPSADSGARVVSDAVCAAGTASVLAR